MYQSFTPFFLFIVKIVDMLMMMSSFLKITQCVVAESCIFSVTRNSLIAVSIRSNLRSFIIVWQIIWIRHFWNERINVFQKSFKVLHKDESKICHKTVRNLIEIIMWTSNFLSIYIFTLKRYHLLSKLLLLSFKSLMFDQL